MSHVWIVSSQVLSLKYHLQILLSLGFTILDTFSPVPSAFKLNLQWRSEHGKVCRPSIVLDMVALVKLNLIRLNSVVAGLVGSD